MNKLWDFFVDSLMVFFVPTVSAYFAFSADLFFNAACEEAIGLEHVSNVALAPCHYLFMGRSAAKQPDGEWTFGPRFDYGENFGLKTTGSLLVALPSFVVGTACKALAMLEPAARHRFAEMQAAWNSTRGHPNTALYQSLGIRRPTEWLVSQGHARRPGDERNLATEKEALQHIAAALNAQGIPWWIDCGSCLGCYRYGGVIPWDEDVDVAVLRADFENVRRALNALDPAKYIVQDWSSRDFPQSYLKVFVRKSGKLVDVYGFDVDLEKREVCYVLALEKAFFFPDWWKIRELRFKVPAKFEMVFPLKRALFDGVEVFVPNDTESYLQRYYGKNLAPAKVFDPVTGCYERDLSHPYWQRAYVH